MMARHSDFFVGVRQRGVVLGLEFDHPEGAVAVSTCSLRKRCVGNFFHLSTRVFCSLKPGVVLDVDTCQEIYRSV